MSTDRTIKHRADIVARLKQENPELLVEEIESMVDVILDEMSTALSCGDRVEIRRFGSMSIRKRVAGKARNPRSGAKVIVGDRAVIYYRASRDLIGKLNFDEVANNN